MECRRRWRGQQSPANYSWTGLLSVGRRALGSPRLDRQRVDGPPPSLYRLPKVVLLLIALLRHPLAWLLPPSSIVLLLVSPSCLACTALLRGPPTCVTLLRSLPGLACTTILCRPSRLYRPLSLPCPLALAQPSFAQIFNSQMIVRKQGVCAI